MKRIWSEEEWAFLKVYHASVVADQALPTVEPDELRQIIIDDLMQCSTHRTLGYVGGTWILRGAPLALQTEAFNEVLRRRPELAKGFYLSLARHPGLYPSQRAGHVLNAGRHWLRCLGRKGE